MHAFRKAFIEDASAIASLVNSAYRGDASKKGWTTEADLLDGQRTDTKSIMKMIETGHIELIVDQASNIFGCVYLEPQEKGLYLGMLTVNPDLQAKGTGKTLLLRAEAYAREKFLDRIFMTVIASRKELISFYERRGYRDSGEIQAFPVGDEFGIHKVDGIVLKVFEKHL